MSKKLKIAEVAERLNLHPHKIRVWGYNGLFEADRQSGKDRLFNEADIKRLEKIKFILESGFNLFSLKIALEITTLNKLEKTIKEKQ